jgi:hypothetical protein
MLYYSSEFVLKASISIWHLIGLLEPGIGPFQGLLIHGVTQYRERGRTFAFAHRVIRDPVRLRRLCCYQILQKQQSERNRIEAYRGPKLGHTLGLG